MVANNGIDTIDGGSIVQMIFETCVNEGVDDLTATTISSLVYEKLHEYNMDKFTSLLYYKRARAFEEPDVSKEAMAEFGKTVSKIIVEEIIMNENITVLK